MKNFFIIVFAFFLSINSSFAYKSNVLPSSFCNKLYAKLNLGEKGLTEKIGVFVEYSIEAIKINELNNNFEIGLDKTYSYTDENVLEILKENFSEEPSIKDSIGKYTGKYCLFVYEKGISEKKFIDLKRYYNDQVSSRKGAHSYIKVYPSGVVMYRIKDEYNVVLETKFDFRRFPFDKHTIILAEYTLIIDLIEFIKSKAVKGEFKKMNETKEFGVISPGWKIISIEQYEYFTPEDYWWIKDSKREYSIGSVQVFLDVERNSFSYILKFAFPIIFIVLIAWGVFWIDPRDIKTRAELSIISLLSLIAFNFVMSDKLPDLNYLTLLDSLVLTSYLFAGTATILSIIGNSYVRKKNIKITMLIDQQARIWGPVVYILFNLVFGYAVSTHPI